MTYPFTDDSEESWPNLDGRETLGAGSLHFPTGVAYLHGAVYVSNWGIATGQDGPFGPGNHGQLVKINQ